MRVTVLYDFTSEVQNELSIIGEYFHVSVINFIDKSSSSPVYVCTAGEILTVSDTDVGNGWWEGINSKGVKGIFPASCKSIVEMMSSPLLFLLYSLRA